jgi:hypothetical protein
VGAASRGAKPIDAPQEVLVFAEIQGVDFFSSTRLLAGIMGKF